jgi:hypothetical protein
MLGETKESLEHAYKKKEAQVKDKMIKKDKSLTLREIQKLNPNQLQENDSFIKKNQTKIENIQKYQDEVQALTIARQDIYKKTQLIQSDNQKIISDLIKLKQESENYEKNLNKSEYKRKDIIDRVLKIENRVAQNEKSTSILLQREEINSQTENKLINERNKLFRIALFNICKSYYERLFYNAYKILIASIKKEGR